MCTASAPSFVISRSVKDAAAGFDAVRTAAHQIGVPRDAANRKRWTASAFFEQRSRRLYHKTGSPVQGYDITKLPPLQGHRRDGVIVRLE